MECAVDDCRLLAELGEPGLCRSHRAHWRTQGRPRLEEFRFSCATYGEPRFDLRGLTITAAEREATPTPDGLIPVTVNEKRRLIDALILRPRQSLDRLLHWSTWRRRHQARARICHYRSRDHHLITNYGCRIRRRLAGANRRYAAVSWMTGKALVPPTGVGQLVRDVCPTKR